MAYEPGPDMHLLRLRVDSRLEHVVVMGHAVRGVLLSESAMSG